MDEAIVRALAIGPDSSPAERTIDITTVGRRSGIPRRIEVWFHRVDGHWYITGVPGPRSWYANLRANPRFTLHLKHGAQLPTLHSTMHLYPVNGAAHKAGKNDTPWSYRNAVWSEVIVGVDPDPANKDRITSWATDYWEALHPYGAGGGYVNFMMEGEGEDRIRGTYQGNFDKLVQIKAKYDPDNFFRVNQNIPPEAMARDAA